MKIQLLIYSLGYIFIYFIFSTILYFISVNSGFNGLSLPIFGGGDDGQFYYEQAMKFANGEPYIYTSIHVWVLGVILLVFNTDNVMVLRLFNLIANVIILVMSLLIIKKITNKNTFHIAATLFVLFLLLYPSLLLNSTLSIYRDTWIYAFYLWALYLFINLFIHKGKWSLLVNGAFLLVILFLLGGYRKYALLSFVAGSCIYLLIKILNKKKINLFKIGSILIVGLSSFYMLLRNLEFPIVNLSFSDVLKYRELNLEAGGSQMGISLDQPNIVIFYLNYFYSIISNFVGPFPWQVTNGATLLLMVSEGVIFIFVAFYLLRKVKRFSEVELYLLIQVILWFMLIGISNDNFGTGSRLRIVGWIPLMIIFVKYLSEGIVNRKLKKEK